MLIVLKGVGGKGTVDAVVAGVQPTVLGVGVIDTVPKRSDDLGGTLPLSDHVGRIHFAANDTTDFFKQPQKFIGSECHVACVRLHAEPNAVIVGNLTLFHPVGNETLVPLPLIDVHQLGRVGLEYPVRLLIAGNSFGQAQQHSKARPPQLLGQRASVPKLLQFGVGNHGIAM